QDRVWVRTDPPPAPLFQSLTYPGTGSGRAVVNLAGDPLNPLTAGVIDTLTVYLTRDAGGTWTDITGNLQSLNPGQLRSIAFVTNSTGEALLVGGNNGVFVALARTGFVIWDRLGSGFPNAQVYDLDYNSLDDILIAGTLGRGAWALNHPAFSATLFSATFDALPDGFMFVADAFGTDQPRYSSGNIVDESGFGGRGLRVVVGGVDNKNILDMSGGWRRSFYLSQPQSMSVTFDFRMTQTPDYDSDESSQALVRWDNQASIEVANITGDGPGGPPITTGSTSRVVDLGCLPAGTRTVTIGVRNNKKTKASQSTELILDNVELKANGSCLIP
ncbi:MAG: hypothetical protein J2P31_17830, partial [Blastocatellia bacterium]|nr:hypothetical protein [Blastocatellia bacterium]